MFGNSGNGFHFCKRLEDSLRYFDALHHEVAVAEVIGSGEIARFKQKYMQFNLIMRSIAYY